MTSIYFYLSGNSQTDGSLGKDAYTKLDGLSSVPRDGVKKQTLIGCLHASTLELRQVHTYTTTIIIIQE